MSRFRFRVLTAVMLSLVALCAPQGASAETPAELKKARGQFQRGIELEQASNWSEAIQQFREVGQVRMTPQVRFHIAFCEEGLGRLVTALGGYELALAEADQVGPDFRNEVETAVVRLHERIPKLMIERGSGAEAALVQIDGVDLGASSVGVEVPLDPGPHTVTAAAPGYLPFTATADLKEREVTRVVLELAPEPIPPPDAVKPPPPVIIVEPAQTPNRLVPYVIGGFGAASLISAGVLFVLEENAQADLEKACPDKENCPRENKGTYDRWRFYSIAAPVAAGVGVVAIGVAVGLIVFEKKKPPTARTSLEVTPLVFRSGAGASLGGQF